MVHPLEELNDVLASFVEQEDRFVLLLTSRDEEIPLVAKALDALDQQAPQDVFFTDVAPVRNASEYANEVARNAWNQLAEVNEERQAQGKPPLADIPSTCWSPQWTPAQRMVALMQHMLSWLPPDEENRLVVSLLPADIHDRAGYADLLGGLVPFHGHEEWMRRVRLILRDDGAIPFAEAALRKAGARSALLYTTQVTVAGIADATAREAEDPSLPPARRINALLQCAGFDVALGRYDAAVAKYGTLYTYYDQHNVPEMKAVAVQGVGDVMLRANRFPAARDKYLQALDIASDAKSLALILQVCVSLGDVDERLGNHTEAARVFAVGAGAAEKLGNGFAQADMLERCGGAHAAYGDRQRAGEGWTAAANVARDFGYDARLASVLERLRDLCASAGYDELAHNYDNELREVQHRLGRVA